MAPPSSRRSGHSRRAQYSVFTGYVVAGIGALIGGVLLGISLWQPQAFSGLRNGANEVVAPAGSATSVVRNNGRGFFDSIAGYLKAGSEHATLKEEVELARIRLAEAEAVEQENARLKALLDLKDNEVEPVTVSRLVGSTSSS